MEDYVDKKALLDCFDGVAHFMEMWRSLDGVEVKYFWVGKVNNNHTCVDFYIDIPKFLTLANEHIGKVLGVEIKDGKKFADFFKPDVEFMKQLLGEVLAAWEYYDFTFGEHTFINGDVFSITVELPISHDIMHNFEYEFKIKGKYSKK